MDLLPCKRTFFYGILRPEFSPATFLAGPVPTSPAGLGAGAMVLEISETRGTVVITLVRRFDVDSAPLVENELGPVIVQNPKRVLFDFSKTDYVSSAGIRVLLKVTRSLEKEGCTVAFSSLNQYVEYVFEIAGFTKVFRVFKTQKKALKYLDKKG
jgi:anti-sigma B factor antagonist